jgi:NADH:ubiquinone oxidoreductase subunit F (NADH-binding)
MLRESCKTVTVCRINVQILNVVASRTFIHHGALNNQKKLFSLCQQGFINLPLSSRDLLEN